ncbi:helix-turn-helix transcriptional regulator, partial [Candidatus Desantisbacteria bacterium]|nr:helix-turn-helix transcriptional regulator [Candidatus Desantisbacteria bacterium]
ILEQKNSALKEILEQIEIEKKRVKNDIYANIDKLVFPALKKLRKKTSPASVKFFDIIQNNLESLTSSFGYKITEKKINLTPREIEICNMINAGLTNKEMSELLNISVHTIESHRIRIRKKFGIIHQNINLFTYLQYLNESD